MTVSDRCHRDELAFAVHDLNNALTTIRLRVDLLGWRRPDVGALHDFDDLERGVQTAERALEQLRAVLNEAPDNAAVSTLSSQEVVADH